MRAIFLSILLSILNTSNTLGSQKPVCWPDRAQLPLSWQPSTELHRSLISEPWSKKEERDVEYAVTTGLDEIIGYFKRKPSAIQSLGDDAIESVIQFTYASANTPEFDKRAYDTARFNLTQLINPFLAREPGWVLCDDFENLLPLAIFAHRLYSANDKRTEIITDLTNIAYRSCGSLETAIGYNYRDILSTIQARPEVLFELYIWALWLTEAELYPNIELPDDARKFGPALWKYFETYRLAGANEFQAGPWDKQFVEIAQLATHMAHIPTGTHRFPLYVQDLPTLYRFHRENFYPVLLSGDLGLFASFMDTLRQYGCTEENDVQVRDGTRYMLKVFHDNNDRWMNYRRGNETDLDIDDYYLIHHPWTAVIGLRARNPLQPMPTNYGGMVRRWLPRPR